MLRVWVSLKLQAVVYDILPSTTAVFSYATGSRKLSVKEHFFVVGVYPLEGSGSGTNMTVEASPSTHVNMRRIHRGLKEEFHLDSNDFGFI